MVAMGQLPDLSEKSGTFKAPGPAGWASGHFSAAPGTVDLMKIHMPTEPASAEARARPGGVAARSPMITSLSSTLSPHGFPGCFRGDVAVRRYCNPRAPPGRGVAHVSRGYFWSNVFQIDRSQRIDCAHSRTRRGFARRLA